MAQFKNMQRIFVVGHYLLLKELTVFASRYRCKVRGQISAIRQMAVFFLMSASSLGQGKFCHAILKIAKDISTQEIFANFSVSHLGT